MNDDAREKLIKRLKEHPLRKRPLYSERVGKDGYIEIKFADIPHGTRRQNWKNKQIWIYEQHHGVKVNTPKEAVVFLDGNIRNFDIDNLMLVPRRVLIVANRIHKFTDNKEQNLAIINQVLLKLAINDLGEKYGLVYKFKNFRVLKSTSKKE